jgi:phosphoribosyl-AMP cyclohydrolase / phosphoribosyl-ATP pyrophosphohydrolase
MIKRVDFDKMNGLVPAVIQDADDGVVLMVGFMNSTALERTLDEGRVTFWSRTKERLWQKGESSGNYLEVVSADLDCDGDTLLIKAQPRGPVCHTGSKSCFPHQPEARTGKILSRLTRIISERKVNRPKGSYTSRLFNEGEQKIAQKVGEEAIELVIAAQYSDKQRCVEEAGDLVYHLLVLLAAKEISLEEVEAELEKRMGETLQS